MACRRREAYCSDAKLYDDYYVGQAGYGMPYFSGTQIQRGHGLGNILSGIMRAAMPLVKGGVKALGKQGLQTGMQIAGDVLSGKKTKQAVKKMSQTSCFTIVHSIGTTWNKGHKTAPAVKRRRTWWETWSWSNKKEGI